MKVDPERNPLAWYFLGVHFAEKKQGKEAVEALESFLTHFPDDSGDLVIEAKRLIGLWKK